MSPRVCHAVTFVAIVVIVLALACRASSPCSPPPPNCSTWAPDTPVQAPVEVDLCVAGEASVVLAIENHDGNDVGSLAVRATNSGVRLVAWKGRDVKDTQTVPDSALRGGRLHLKIQYSSHDLRVLTWDDAALMDIPVGGTDSLRVALTKQQPSHNATICSEPASSTTTQRSTTPPPLRNATTTGPATDQTSDATKEEEEGEEEEMVVLLGVGTGLVGVAVTLSLAMLGLTLAFP